MPAERSLINGGNGTVVRTTATGEMRLSTHVVDIVYIGQSLHNGVAFEEMHGYRLSLEWSTQRVPQRGAQIRSLFNQRCGWVKKHCLPDIMPALRAGRFVTIIVTKRGPSFDWRGRYGCCFGKAVLFIDSTHTFFLNMRFSLGHHGPVHAPETQPDPMEVAIQALQCMDANHSEVMIDAVLSTVAPGEPVIGIDTAPAGSSPSNAIVVDDDEDSKGEDTAGLLVVETVNAYIPSVYHGKSDNLNSTLEGSDTE